MLIALPDVSREVLLSTLVVCRLIYYVAPLTIAIALLADVVTAESIGSAAAS